MVIIVILAVSDILMVSDGYGYGDSLHFVIVFAFFVEVLVLFMVVQHCLSMFQVFYKN